MLRVASAETRSAPELHCSAQTAAVPSVDGIIRLHRRGEVAVKYVALLRGINVGGNNRIAMADLRQMLTDLGYADVSTYVQSGNAIFEAGRKSPDKLATDIERAIDKMFSLKIKTFVRSRGQLIGAVERNPFPHATKTPKLFHVGFMSGSPTAAALEALPPEKFAPDEFHVDGSVIYVNYANGVAGTKLTPTFWKKLGVEVTARNWTTVNKLLDLMQP